MLRKTEYHINCGHKIRGFFYKVRLGCLQNQYALHIPPDVCARGLCIIHVGPIQIDSHAVIFIADYVAIGANAVVNKDVTEETVAVAGVPAKKISDN